MWKELKLEIDKIILMRARNKAPFSVPILSECKIGKSISLKKIRK